MAVYQKNKIQEDVRTALDQNMNSDTLKKEMYEEIHTRVVALKSEYPELTISELCAKVIAQPAPKFYLTPGSAKMMICKAKKRWMQEKLRRLRLS
jgi:hypothetical protein